ncbi:MAG: hypothetical protein IKO46_06265 [Salinivirgaceae bacterium]|nr:hypothetical protein [Salinivirgaceae bacterium]
MENKGLIIGLSVLGFGAATFFGWRIYKRKRAEKMMAAAEADYNNTLSNGNKVSDVAQQFINAKTEPEKADIIASALGKTYIADDVKKLSANPFIKNYKWIISSEARDRVKSLLQLP